tara:strand:- start:611 stop:1339 length:729 start_codon:yes stop_codon:yes gene_type:complete
MIINGLYKTIVSLILWPIWYLFFFPSLFIIYLLIYILPQKKYYFFVKPISWIYCFLAGQWLIKDSQPPSLNGQPYLYLFNHVSMFDQFMIGAFISHHITAIGAKEIFRYPIFGNVIKRYGAVPITRNRLKEALNSLEGVERAINNGISFLIAPEGTRTLTGEMGLFKKGPFHLAKNTGVTIVPIGLLGGLKAKIKNDWRLKPGILRIRFGAPIQSDEYLHLSVEEISDLVKKRIQRLLDKGK